MKKKVVSIVIAAMMMVGLMPTQMFAATTVDEARDLKIVDEVRKAQIVEESRGIDLASWFEDQISIMNVSGYDAGRLAGSNRYATALTCAETIRYMYSWTYDEEQFDRIVIASGTNFPDALAGAPLAGAKRGTPILLVDSADAKNQPVYDYINTYVKKDAKVYVLGGEAAVPTSVTNKLAGLGFSNVQRLSGNNRYETNLAIVNEMDTNYGDTVVIATGKNFADSLSISSYAYFFGWPIILVGDSMTEAQLAKLRELNPLGVLIVGGENAVSATVEEQVKSVVGENLKRYAGANRFETSMQIADDWCWTRADYESENTYDETAVLAYGRNFPDALAGGALAGCMDAPIILVDSDSSKQAEFLKTKTEVDTLFVVGGQSAVPDSVVQQFAK